MRFELTDEQRGFADSLDHLLAGADTRGAVRCWAAGDSGPGLKLWARLAELGVTALAVPEEAGGLGASMVDLVVAFEALGRHAVPGPWVESAAYLPALLVPLAADNRAAGILGSLAKGSVGTVAVPPHTPRALDADVAQRVFVDAGGTLRWATAAAMRRSVDPARRLFEVTPGETLAPAPASARPFEVAALATSAQLVGLGERLLAMAVGYAKQRSQFGRVIGEYQALKHVLADVRVRLDFVRPLLYGAALAVDSAAPTASRDVSAAKFTAADTAYVAARTALQVHGAIGYTAEYDLSLWIGKTRALVTAWGTPAEHRASVLTALTDQATT
jgi:alkylation response protein AidB-like acyl-CoA dehydrogenase